MAQLKRKRMNLPMSDEQHDRCDALALELGPGFSKTNAALMALSAGLPLLESLFCGRDLSSALGGGVQVVVDIPEGRGRPGSAEGDDAPHVQGPTATQADADGRAMAAHLNETQGVIDKFVEKAADMGVVLDPRTRDVKPACRHPEFEAFDKDGEHWERCMACGHEVEPPPDTAPIPAKELDPSMSNVEAAQADLRAAHVSDMGRLDAEQLDAQKAEPTGGSNGQGVALDTSVEDELHAEMQKDAGRAKTCDHKNVSGYCSKCGIELAGDETERQAAIKLKLSELLAQGVPIEKAYELARAHANGGDGGASVTELFPTGGSPEDVDPMRCPHGKAWDVDPPCTGCANASF